MAFEYRMEVLIAHPDFTILSQMHGTVNAGGGAATELVFEYEPKSLTTASCQV